MGCSLGFVPSTVGLATGANGLEPGTPNVKGVAAGVAEGKEEALLSVGVVVFSPDLKKPGKETGEGIATGELATSFADTAGFAKKLGIPIPAGLSSAGSVTVMMGTDGIDALSFSAFSRSIRSFS